MKAHIPQKQISEVEKALIRNKVTETAKERQERTLLDFRLGANSIAKLALNQYKNPIHNAKTFEELKLLAEELIDTLSHAVLSEQEQKESEVATNGQSNT